MQTSSNLHISSQGVAFIGAQEGLRLCAYRDSKEVWTIGYGHTSQAGDPKVYSGMTITAEQALEILTRDLLKYEQDVLREVTFQLNQHQFDALVSFTYNLGATNLRKLVAMTDLNSGNVDSVPQAIEQFVHADGKVLQGLVHRRRAEAAMFAGNYEPDCNVELASN